jgi:predicted hydrocarbon binding protein
VTSGLASGAEVLEGKDGMLVDTFHTGLEAGGEYLMLVRRRALAAMLNTIYRMLGSAGEVLLFQEGMAVGRADGEAFVKSLGAKKVRDNIRYLRNNLAAQGWGRIETESDSDDEMPRVLVRDCFECSSDKGERAGCHFFRGYIAGTGAVTFGQEVAVEETRCTLSGDDACVFAMTQAGK